MQSYIKRGRLLDLQTEVQSVPPDEDVGHVGNVPVRRPWVQLARRPVNTVVYIIRKHKTYLISAVYYTCAHCTNYSRLAVIHVLQADTIIQVPTL